jgi:hypothetical protein
LSTVPLGRVAADPADFGDHLPDVDVPLAAPDDRDGGGAALGEGVALGDELAPPVGGELAHVL